MIFDSIEVFFVFSCFSLSLELYCFIPVTSGKIVIILRLFPKSSYIANWRLPDDDAADLFVDKIWGNGGHDFYSTKGNGLTFSEVIVPIMLCQLY